MIGCDVVYKKCAKGVCFVMKVSKAVVVLCHVVANDVFDS
jgi:hypothetical protein